MNKKEKPIKLPRNLLLPFSMIGLICGLYAYPHQTMMRIFYIVVVALIVDWIYLMISSRSLMFSVSGMSKQVKKGEEVSLSLNIGNRSFLPSPYVYVFLKESCHITSEPVNCLCLTVSGKRNETYEIKYKAKWSGEDEVEIAQIVIVDYFELWHKKLKFSWKQKVNVLPVAIPMKEATTSIAYVPHQNKEDYLSKLSKENEGEISYELSPYREGQPERQIHWKLVAQRDIYMIREREVYKEKQQTYLVVLDPLVNRGVEKKMNLREQVFTKAKYRYKRTCENEMAMLEDYRLSACISYLNEVIAQKQRVVFKYYRDHEWQQMVLNQKFDLEQVSLVLSGAFCEKGQLMKQRLPLESEKQYEKQVILSAHVDKEIIQYMNERTNVLLLALQQQPLKYKGNRYAYVGKDYTIKNCL